ncbi:hypothetical protein EHV15_34070 [Paenibacillus oralis]|uniref:Uncharacterized protein n=1 Tax=Paenibacillus oralis TaxID=2490856 RepID=A0A3P3T9A2_9BACL|nr:hypothetical protein [Paenibacillus oralis]RRJ54626.1 hypothetical protein EHV15_34070 [Paenibacillus oralis]
MIILNHNAVLEASQAYFKMVYKYWICEASLQKITEEVAKIELSKFSEGFLNEYESFKKLYEQHEGDLTDIEDGKSAAAALFMEMVLRFTERLANAREIALEITYSDPEQFTGGLSKEWGTFITDIKNEER